ncbi:MAG: hypothetical protein ACOYMD_04675 [Paludibacter sp.]
MRKRVGMYIIISIFVVAQILTFFVYTNHICVKENKNTNNLIHSKKIKIGMLENEVINIMGKPDTIINENVIIFCYEIDKESYANGQIIFDSTMMVKEIYFPE